MLSNCPEACTYIRVRKDYTPLHVYLGCVWVVIYVKYITYEGLLHNTLPLDVDTVQEACVYTANSSLTHKTALCEWFRLSEPVQAERGSGSCSRRAKFWLAESFYLTPGQRRFAELFLLKLIKRAVKFFWKGVLSLSRQYVDDVRVSWVYLQRFRRYLVDRQPHLF